MRNHSFLYLLRPDGEEGELQRIAESNSVFPSLWKLLFSDGRIASAQVRRVLAGAAAHVIEVDAERALQRYEQFKRLLLETDRAPMLSAVCARGPGSGREWVDGLSRYLDGAALHLCELIDDWRLIDADPPVFCADFDEMTRPEGETDDFLRDRLAEFACLWTEVQRLDSNADACAIESLLGFRSSNLRVTDWRAWSGLFGLALFEHDYFQKAFRKPFQCDYADFKYDPLGIEDDLGGGLHRFREGDHWGVRATQEFRDRIVLSPQWDRVLRAGTGTHDIVWVKRDGKFGLAAVTDPRAGALLTRPELDEVGHFEGGVAPVRMASKMGFLRTDGTWLLAPAWDRVWPFRYGCALVEIDHHLTYIDSRGARIVAACFDEADQFSEHGVARVRTAGRYGLLRATGELALDLVYDQIEWSDSLRGWLCARNRMLTLVRPDATHWLDGEWEQIDACVPGESIRVRRNRRFGLLDWSGRALTEIEYESIESLRAQNDSSESTVLVARRGNRVGVLDGRGKQIVPFEYSRIEPLLDVEDDVEDEVGSASKYLLVYSLPNRSRPKLGIWDLDRGCLRVACEHDRETLPKVGVTRVTKVT